MPAWFFDIYDAMILNVPVFEATSIRRVPLYVRFRVRTVHELMRAARMKIAAQHKAFKVYDFSNY